MMSSSLTSSPKGFFITFEGGEGVGKSTQIIKLRELLELKGFKVFQTREPGGCIEAEIIRNVLLQNVDHHFEPLSEALLIFAARYEHIIKKIKPALEAGQIVLCDRFMDSTLVYQGYGGGVPIDLLQNLQRLTLGNISPDFTFLPDLTFLLDMPIEESHKRRKSRENMCKEIQPDRFESKNQDFHKKLREGFLDLAQKEPNRIFIVNAQENIDQIASKILKIVEDRLVVFSGSNDI